MIRSGDPGIIRSGIRGTIDHSRSDSDTRPQEVFWGMGLPVDISMAVAAIIESERTAKKRKTVKMRRLGMTTEKPDFWRDVNVFQASE